MQRSGSLWSCVSLVVSFSKHIKIMIFKFVIENENKMGRKESKEDTGPRKVSTRGLGTDLL